MSAIINRYSHVFSTWEVYPRVHFFQRRFVDLHRRFRTLTGAFPSTYNDPNVLSDIEKLNNALKKSLTVTVFGKDDIRSSEFADSGYEIDDKPECGINVLICHARLNDTDENSLQDVEDMFNQATKYLEGKQSLDFVVCYCDTCPDSSENNVIEALLQVSTRVNEAHGYKGIAPENIIIGKNAFTLQNKISELLESRIVDGLVKISSYLQRFVRVDRHYDQENLDILKTKACVKAVQDFLGNGHSLYDMRRKAATEEVFLDQVICKLSSIIRCAVVPEMATKHNLQLWMCNKLLQEVNFEKSLRENVSKNTRYHLSKLAKYYFEVYKTPSTPSTSMSDTQTKSHSFDYLVYYLQNDLAGEVTNAEKKLSAMHYLTNIMRKMMYEIKGYMRQTVVQLQSQDEPDFSAPDIADQLRENVLTLEGVYAIGTLYGQLEIHLDKSNAEDSSNVREEITTIMNECQFQHPYVIKEVSMKPKRMANNFYEQGDTLRCPFPDNYDNIREGTLGCFVKGRDNKHYGLTSAHVVNPKPKTKLNVMVQKRGQTYKRFGKSQDNLCVLPSEGSLHHIDIAAVMVYSDVTMHCNFSLKDDIGQIKPAHVVNKSRKELSESFVFKSGAKTGITKE
ncbi:uncharacterized protein LOC123549672 [Mercenaria mercenaria]|uniref:uncharacterized protein LOC123549672 n=1 Tax=Mercenaria mercenaria TaxID=6596 RepID=UPI00234F0B99|nr:uncharacterized protein LOC123549672 [Mercenaria mercenaria]